MSFLEKLTAPTLAVPRQEGEVDLVKEVHERLLAANISFASTWLDQEEIKAVTDQNSGAQRIAIGRNLSYLFRVRSPQATAERVILSSQSGHEEYLHMFDRYVIPGLKQIDTQ